MSKKNDNLDFDLDALLHEFEAEPSDELDLTELPVSDDTMDISMDDLDKLLGDFSEVPDRKKAAAPEKAPKKPVESEKKPAEKKTAGKKLLEKKPAEKKPVENKPAEKKPVENKPAEKKPAEKKPLLKKKAAKEAPSKKEEDDFSFDLDELNQLLGNIPEPTETIVEEAPEKVPAEEKPIPQEETPATMDTVSLMAVIRQLSEEAPAQPETEKPAAEEKTVSEEPTIRMAPVSHAAEEKEAAVSEDATIRLSGEEHASLEEQISQAAEKEAAKPRKKAPASSPIAFMNPRAKLHLLKKQLVAGPEKRYYELSEIGSGKLQIAILVCLILVLLCAGTTSLFTMGFVPENRLRLVIFSQVFAMLASALMGSHLMMDAVGDLFKARFTPNTLLVFTFLVCCVDAVFCFRELRVPCCAAFSLAMAMALLARYHRRTTEMGQMDTLRKAVKLIGLIREPDYYEGDPGVLREETELKHFMDHYNEISGPEKLQNLYALLALPLCIAISAFTGMLHGFSTAVQILAVSLLVALPASVFISLTRPMAVLEKRLHMVGTVLCGWQGVKKLCGKIAFPIRDSDLFPLGSTKLNGVKFYGDRNPDQVVSYSTSLITAVGSGLTGTFEQLLNSRDGTIYPVSNLHSHEGGIGGEVEGVSVLMGNLDFLQDMGVEVPQGSTVAQAVYAAIDGELSAVYAITYAKMRSASAGLVSLSGCRKLTTVLTGGDFMLTDDFLQEKFNIKTRNFSFPDQESRKELAGRQPDPETPAAAISIREDLVSAAYAVSGARALNRANRLGLAIHMVGGILGLLMMAVLGYLGSTELLTPTHVLLYQLVWMVPGFLITEWTRTV